MTTATKLREEGIKEGLRQKAIEDAKNLLNLDVNINIISQATGLSINEIKKLR